MPSGRWIDSILMTSAPNAANECVAAGPAQNAVRSTIRTPASGSSAAAVGALRIPLAAKGIRCPPRRVPAPAGPGPAPRPTSATVRVAAGSPPGCRHRRRARAGDPSAGSSSRCPAGRSAAGTAGRVRRSPSTVRSAHPRPDAFTDPVPVVPSPDLETKCGISVSSGQSDHRGEVEPLLSGDHADADVAVLDASSIDGTSTDRRIGGTFSSCECSHSLLCIRVIASSIDMSRCPPGPPRRTRRRSASAP